MYRTVNTVYMQTVWDANAPLSRANCVVRRWRASETYEARAAEATTRQGGLFPDCRLSRSWLVNATPSGRIYLACSRTRAIRRNIFVRSREWERVPFWSMLERADWYDGKRCAGWFYPARLCAGQAPIGSLFNGALTGVEPARVVRELLTLDEETI